MSFSTDTLFCVANYKNSLNTDLISPCTLFHGDVKQACQSYIETNHVSTLQSCFSAHLRSSIDVHVSNFIDFIENKQKVYLTVNEIIERFYIFKDNMIFVDIENSKGNSYILGATKFADLLNSEYIDLYLSNKRPFKNYCTDRTLSSTMEQSIDWESKGAVTKVKDQGQCGSCWSFSSVGSLEGLYAINTGKLVDFSEQELVSCASSYGNNGCNGGLMQNAFSYVIDNGIATDQSYPYTSGTSTKSESCKSHNSTYKIKSCFNVPSNEYQLTQYLNLQPVSVSIEADSKSFQLYSSGVYDNPDCGTTLDHGVLAVGYGTLNGKDYYKVKNSWSTSWGDHGYIYIARNSNQSSLKGICGIAMDASVPN